MERLEDLKTEALFFGIESLERVACDAALYDIRAAIEQLLEPEPKPKAKCCYFLCKPMK